MGKGRCLFKMTSGMTSPRRRHVSQDTNSEKETGRRRVNSEEERGKDSEKWPFPLEVKHPKETPKAR